MNFVGRYSPADVEVIINGRTFQDLGQDDFITIERVAEDEFTAIIGATGSGLYAENLNKAGYINVSILRNGADNVYCQGLKSAKTLFSIIVRSRQSFTEIITGTNCIVGRAPRLSQSAVPEDRVWGFLTTHLIETAVN